MFVYEQGTGRFLHGSGAGARLLATGYAGAKGCINDPSKDHVRQCGPIPKGAYRLRVSVHPRFTAPAIFCEPEAGTVMHGRSAFFIHGDNRRGDRSASTGCIVLSRLVRTFIAGRLAQGDDRLLVVAGGPDADQGSMGSPLDPPFQLVSNGLLVPPIHALV